jgi:hypothetical protein
MKNKRISIADENRIILELKRWQDGELGSKLTWKHMEKFGFTRQALSARKRIKDAWDEAKKSLSGGLIKSKEQQSNLLTEYENEIAKLQGQIGEYKEKENQWLKRWQRIAINIRAKGVDLSEVDFDDISIEDLKRDKRGKNVNKVLNLFDKDISNHGRT